MLGWRLPKSLRSCSIENHTTQFGLCRDRERAAGEAATC